MARKKIPAGGAPAPKAKRGGKGAKAQSAETDGQPEIATQAQVVTQDDLDDARESAIAAFDKLASVNKSQTNAKLLFGKAVKDIAKKTGFEPTDIKWGLQQRARPVEELEDEIRRRNRILAWLDVKVGGQLGLFEDGTSVASNTASERDQVKDNDPQVLAAAEAQGLEAGEGGANAASNPYPKGSKRAGKWASGYQIGQANIAQRMGGNGKAPTHEPAHA